MLTNLPLIPLAAAVLALWRITHLFWGEDGPGNIFARLRAAAGSGFVGSLLDCFNCLSLWFALPLAALIARSWIEGVVVWLALSGAAILIQRAAEPKAAPGPPPAVWHQQSEPEAQEENSEEQSHVLLR
jgi:hypothetical protein